MKVVVRCNYGPFVRGQVVDLDDREVEHAHRTGAVWTLAEYRTGQRRRLEHARALLDDAEPRIVEALRSAREDLNATGGRGTLHAGRQLQEAARELAAALEGLRGEEHNLAPFAPTTENAT